MNKVFGSIYQQFREFFKSVGPTKRMSIIVATVVSGIAIVVLIAMLGGREYADLFTNVPPENITVITEKLSQKKIDYQLRDDGKTIAVPKEFLHSTLMALSSELGSSKVGNVGLEMFEKQDFSTNSYTQKIQFQRALQGELIRAINTLSAVKQSKVLLALPDKKTFMEEPGQTTASVVVELQPGKTLAADQIRGIRFLVANAVQGLDADHVTVLDDRGKMLSHSGDSATGGSSELLELKHNVESELENRIETILSKVVGQAKVIARVEATLNNKITQATETSVDPDKTAIRSLQSEEESLDGARNNPAGVPGSRSNLPGAEDSGQVGFKQDVKKEIKTTNYDVPKTVRNIRESAGGIDKISVAVLVDGVTVNVPGKDGASESKWNPRSPEEMQKYENLVKSAIGFNNARGDSVKIENIQFIAEDFSESDKMLTSLERRKLFYSFMKWALILTGLTLFFFIVVRPFMQWITDSFQESVEDMLPRTIEELEELQSIDNTLPGMSAALPVLEESIDPDKAETELLRDRILAIMEQDQEKANSAFSMWLVRKDANQA